jgi:polyisoprenoid-binding protein YceI
MTTGATTEKEANSEDVHYRLVADDSRFTVQAFSEGLLSAFGHDPVIAIRNFSGEAQFSQRTFEAASLKVRVDVNSLTVIGDVKEKDRLDIERTMRDEVLEVHKYPEITFLSTDISVSMVAADRYRTRVIGDLTLHGVTQKNFWISAETTIKDDSLRAQGKFSLKQPDFGIKPYSAVGGTLKLKNQLKFSFDIVAKKEE